MGTPTTYPLAKFYVSESGDASPLASPTECYEIISESIGKQGTILDTSGSVGTRAHKKERTRSGIYTVGGDVSLYPTPSDMRKWLPRIFGAAESGGGPYTYAVAETLPEFYVTKDLGTKVFQYTGCKVARATISGQAGGMVTLAMNIQGKTETVNNSGSVSSAPIPDTATHPLMFFEGAFTLQGSARPVSSFELTIDNVLDLERFNNSQTRTHLTELDRIVTLDIVTPYTAGTGTGGEADLYDQGYIGAAATLVFTSTVDAAHVLTFSIGALQVPPATPTANARGEIVLRQTGVARMSSSTAEIGATLAVA